MKTYIFIAIAVVLVGVGGYFLLQNSQDSVDGTQDQDTGIDTAQLQDQEQPVDTSDTEQGDEGESIIGKSVEGREITAYHYGKGTTELLFIGGIHGGYEWNTTLVAFELMDYLEENPSTIPENIQVTVIPVLNPDGLQKIVGTADRFTKADVLVSLEESIPGRFNANNVDLNRNFDCDWKSTGTWQDRTVSGGSKAFSEPESLAIKNYVETNSPDAVVVWYSAAGGVFSSSCLGGVLPETRTITDIYAKASGYPAHEDFDFYEITGDAVDWLAKNNIPAISVLLSTHEDVEWTKNKAGIEALFEHYTK